MSELMIAGLSGMALSFLLAQIFVASRPGRPTATETAVALLFLAGFLATLWSGFSLILGALQ